MIHVFRTSRRTRIAGICLTVTALHLVGLALFSQGEVAAAGALAWIVASPFVLLAFQYGPRVVRAVAAGIPGLGMTAAGLVTHAGRTAFNGPSAGDFSGITVAIAGIVLLVLAGRELFAGTRRLTKLLWIPLAFVLLQFYVMPVLVTGTVATNAPRGDDASSSVLGIAGAEDVAFNAADGVRLRGWFVPGGASAVVVLHGSHGTRSSTKDYIRFLHDAGYTVLAYDARGHGASGGNENALGWYGDRDLDGAVAWLRERGARRVAALGLSMGGEEALRAAANGVPLSAVVADGAGSGTLGDAQLEQGTDSALFTAVTWVGMRTVSLFSGDSEPPALSGIVGLIDAPVLLIASNRRNERRIDAEFRSRIGPRAKLWYLADTGHTQGLDRHPGAYRARVLAFLDGALR